MIPLDFETEKIETHELLLQTQPFSTRAIDLLVHDNSGLRAA